MIRATASSDTRAAAPLRTRSRAAICRSAGKRSIQPYESFAGVACEMGSDNDIDMPVGDLELGPTQGEPFAARMAAGPQIELPAVPGADNVLALRVVLQHPGFAVFIHRLADPAGEVGADTPAP